MRAQLAERLGLARDLIQSRCRDGGDLAILGLHERSNLLQELHQRGRQELAVLGTDRRQTAHRDDRLIERGERGVTAVEATARERELRDRPMSPCYPHELNHVCVRIN